MTAEIISAAKFREIERDYVEYYNDACYHVRSSDTVDNVVLLVEEVNRLTNKTTPKKGTTMTAEIISAAKFREIERDYLESYNEACYHVDPGTVDIVVLLVEEVKRLQSLLAQSGAE